MFARLMGLKTVSPAELQTLIQSRHVTVVDVNALPSWQRAHVPGAVRLDPDEYKKTDLPKDKHRLLVFYCSNPMCRKAPKAARRAGGMGYTDVRVLSAGITGWVAAGLPVESAC